jgi:hypothetical protein
LLSREACWVRASPVVRAISPEEPASKRMVPAAPEALRSTTAWGREPGPKSAVVVTG